MPSAAARRVHEDQIPPFMSVFDLDADTMADRDTVTLLDPRMVDLSSKASSLTNPPDRQSLCSSNLVSESTHKHNDSSSTQMSESADSSPTTTLSTTDSSPLSDPSPSSSPDSPVNLIPLKNYPATTFGMQSKENPPQIGRTTGTMERPMTSPSPRRPRNMKGLSIQPPSAVTTTTSLVSEPSSPSFIKPKIPGMKRKPSQLSLKTNTTDLLDRTVPPVPPSPAMPPILQRRALKHSTSSPHMLGGLDTSTFGPAGGMTFPKMLERNESGLSEVLRPMKSSIKATFDSTIMEEDTPIRPQMANRADYEPYHQSVNNEDQKSPGYPNGPIAIYGDSVFLYLEPTAEEAARFDVVINVAQEVKNPFAFTSARPLSKAMEVASPRQWSASESPIPDTAVTTASYATAFEFPPPQDSSPDTPTTPKASSTKTPEYIHIHWDHNTDIAPDLMSLCETIEKRTKQGKTVLIHCQQGASRSASLIIAYGLYQKPELSVNDAYYAAQSKSRWISPNMKLMYSLQDFHKDLAKRRAPPPTAFRPRTSRSPTKHRLTLSADAIDVTPEEPHTAPLPGQADSANGPDSKQGPTRPRGNSTPVPHQLSPGPATAPPNLSWSREAEQTKSAEKESSESGFPFTNLPLRPKSRQEASRADGTLSALAQREDPPPTPGGIGSHATFGFQSLGFPRFHGPETSPEPQAIEQTLKMAPAFPTDNVLLSPRAETMTDNPLSHAFEEASAAAGMHFEKSPLSPTEGLFSPRATMFPRDPLSPFGRPSQFADPRSPPTKGETPIVRSIDDLI